MILFFYVTMKGKYVSLLIQYLFIIDLITINKEKTKGIAESYET